MEHITAPEIGRLIDGFDRTRLPEVVKPSPELAAALDRLFGVLADLAPSDERGEVKKLWLRFPRGDVADYGDFDEMLAYGEVSSREEFEQWRLDDYPEDPAWFRLTAVESGAYRAVNMNGVTVASTDAERERSSSEYLDDVRVELIEAAAAAADESMRLLREGAYNYLVAEELPYRFRIGVVPREAVWRADPESREALFEKMPDGIYREFREYAEEGAEDDAAVDRLKSMTGNDFLRACALGYTACGYDTSGTDGGEASPVELYMRYADGRDEGLTPFGDGLCSGPGIDLDSPAAWNEWYFDGKRAGGHPWEVCRGGNSTHVSLYVDHDGERDEFLHRIGEMSDEEYEAGKDGRGYYYHVAGEAWTRSAEAVCFYVALKRAGLPVVLTNAEAIYDRFEGRDLIGIVPHDRFTRYCEDLFPEELGEILDFMHVYEEDLVAFGDSITWLEEEKATLL